MTRLLKLMAVALLLFPSVTTAADLPDDLPDDLSDTLDVLVARNIEGAMSVLGISAVPSETSSALFLNTGNGGGDQTYDFQSAQLGGGFRWSEDFGLWLEGYLGWNRYDPVMIFSNGDDESRIPLKWNSFAATGGIGYEFDLTEHLVFRPQLLVSVGRIQTDLSIGSQVIAERLGLDADFLIDGGVTVGGLGGAASLVYNRRWDSDYELDIDLSYSYISFEPIAGDKDLAGQAEAATATLWTRLRQPTGYDLFQRPIRLVYEASGSYLPGDQGKVLDTEWLAQVGFGGEIDLAETWVPWVTTTRLVARYTWGERLEGYSIGLACSF